MNKVDFMKKYNIDDEKLEECTINWDVLVCIYNDYCKIIKDLKAVAELVVKTFYEYDKIHSVRYRIKDPEHLIEKIIRKNSEDPDFIVDVNNYRNEITDIIGIRLIHLFKNDWEVIHNIIKDNFDLAEMPTANFRIGDNTDLYSSHDCKLKEHKFGYRSVHYIVNTKPQKEKLNVEIQVRTIYEEGWSEIDHSIRYPYKVENELLTNYLNILNGLSGNADEMGTYINILDKHLDEIEDIHLKEISQKDKLIESLKSEIKKLKISDTQKNNLEEKIEDLNKNSTSYTSSKDVFRTVASLLQYSPPIMSLGISATSLFHSMPELAELTSAQKALQKSISSMSELAEFTSAQKTLQESIPFMPKLSEVLLEKPKLEQKRKNK